MRTELLEGSLKYRLSARTTAITALETLRKRIFEKWVQSKQPHKMNLHRLSMHAPTSVVSDPGDWSSTSARRLRINCAFMASTINLSSINDSSREIK